MIDVAAIRSAFPELTGLTPFVESGQRDVLRGRRNGEDVVLKLIRADTAEAQERILREVEAVSQLPRDYIPRIHSYGRRAVGAQERLFIIEEYTPGETYRDALGRQPVQQLRDVLHLTDVLLRACCDFEKARLVHRDIKPENLIVGTGGRIWIIDFGIVRLLDLASVTPTGRPVGSFTPGYGAPEQMRNLKPRIDARADLFSVGIVLYESLVGTNPYLNGASNQLEVMRRVDNQDLPPLSIPDDPSGEFSLFISSLVARFPSRRPQTAAKARQWFDEIRQKIGG